MEVPRGARLVSMTKYRQYHPLLDHFSVDFPRFSVWLGFFPFGSANARRHMEMTGLRPAARALALLSESAAGKVLGRAGSQYHPYGFDSQGSGQSHAPRNIAEHLAAAQAGIDLPFDSFSPRANSKIAIAFCRRLLA
jgi:hypothetical protein